jgi:hypothetical protein
MSLFAALFEKRRRARHRSQPESELVVTADVQQVTLSHPRRATETLAWADLRQLGIVTTDDGHRRCDWFWLLHGSRSGLASPQGATGERALLERLQKLPGFDHRPVIETSPLAGPQRVPCWTRQA